MWGGSDPHSAAEYHPLVVTAAAGGGLERLPAQAQKAARVLAGAHLSRRGKLTPTAGEKYSSSICSLRDHSHSHCSGPISI